MGGLCKDLHGWGSSYGWEMRRAESTREAHLSQYAVDTLYGPSRSTGNNVPI